MAIPARLSRTLHSVLGEEGAEDLVNWMTQVDSNRSDLRELTIWAARADVRFDNIDARLSRVDGQLDGVEKGLADLRVEVKDSMGALEARIKDSMGALEARINDSLVGVKDSMGGLEGRINARITDLFKWSFLFWCGAVGIQVLITLLK